MSKRHYEAIAEILNKSMDSSRIDDFTVMTVAAQLGVFFAQDNSRFDIDRFMAAVGGTK
jgi:hypothetical protein